MDFDDDTDIDALRRGNKPHIVIDREEKPESDILRFEDRNGRPFNEYKAFSLLIAASAIRRLSIKTNKLMQVMPRLDLLYNIASDYGNHFVGLVFPFMTVKLYGRNLGELRDMLYLEQVSHIEEFDPAFHVFPEEFDPEREPVITEIVIDGNEIDAEEERVAYLERSQEEANRLT